MTQKHTAKCLHCGAEIEYLNAQWAETMQAPLDAKGDYGDADSIDGTGTLYFCPVCEKLVAQSEEEALELLNPEQEA